MSIEIKITLPSVKKLNDCGYARNSIFKIVQEGGHVESSAIMQVYRSLDKRKRLDFIKRALYCTVFTKGELDEILANHKRSQWIQEFATITQPSSSKVESSKRLEKLAEKALLGLTTFAEEIFEKQEYNSPLWTLHRTPHGKHLATFNNCFQTTFCSNGLIDEIDEDLLYNISCKIVNVFELYRGRYSGYSYVSWWMNEYLEAVASGTRTSALVPFISSEFPTLEKAGELYLSRMYQSGGVE